MISKGPQEWHVESSATQINTWQQWTHEAWDASDGLRYFIGPPAFTAISCITYIFVLRIPSKYFILNNTGTIFTTWQ